MEIQQPFRSYICGTKKTVKLAEGNYRVVCATCEGGGTVRHKTHEQAMSAATRDSNRPCLTCGAS